MRLASFVELIYLVGVRSSEEEGRKNNASEDNATPDNAGQASYVTERELGRGRVERKQCWDCGAGPSVPLNFGFDDAADDHRRPSTIVISSRSLPPSSPLPPIPSVRSFFDGQSLLPYAQISVSRIPIDPLHLR